RKPANRRTRICIIQRLVDGLRRVKAPPQARFVAYAGPPQPGVTFEQRRSRMVTWCKPLLAALIVSCAAFVAACGSSNSSSSASSSAAPAAPASTSSSTSTPAASSSSGGANAAVAKLVPAAIKSKGTLTVAADASYAPDEFIAPDGHTVVGMDADLSKALAGVMGLKAKVVNATFDTIIPGIASGKYDMGASSF